MAKSFACHLYLVGTDSSMSHLNTDRKSECVSDDRNPATGAFRIPRYRICLRDPRLSFHARMDLLRLRISADAACNLDILPLPSSEVLRKNGRSRKVVEFRRRGRLGSSVE